MQQSEFFNKLLEALGRVSPDESAFDQFESRDLTVSEEVQKLINSGDVKYVLIDEESGPSVLNDLESFAYYGEGITLILHNAERPYLYCLYGEKASKELLDRTGPGVTAFQREHYGRGKGGRPKDLARRKKTLELLKIRDRKKATAAEVMTTENVSSSQSYVSRTRKETGQ